MLTNGPSRDEIETLISISKGALTPNEATSILRRYDNNLQEASVAIYAKPTTTLPIRAAQHEKVPLNDEGIPFKVPHHDSKLPQEDTYLLLSSFRAHEVSVCFPQHVDDFTWFNVATLGIARSSEEGLEATPRTSHLNERSTDRGPNPGHVQDLKKQDNMHTAVLQIIESRDEQITNLQDQMEELRERLVKVAARLEALAEK